RRLFRSTLLPLPRCRECPLLECAAVDELCNQIRPFGELASIMNRKNVRMVKRRRHLSFALKPPSGHGVCSAVANEFDSYRTVDPCINGSVHDAHTAGAQCCFDSVRTHLGARW